MQILNLDTVAGRLPLYKLTGQYSALRGPASIASHIIPYPRQG